MSICQGLAYFFSVIYLLSAGIILLYSLVQFQLLLIYLKKPRGIESSNMPEDASMWPKVTIQLPLYNEPLVVERLLESLTYLNYPADKLFIQILDDSTDSTTKLAANYIQNFIDAGINVELIHRTHRTGYKAGALQNGLANIQGAYIAIFDADFIPSPDFLIKTLPYFIADPQIAVVQTRWGFYNEHFSLLTALQAFQLNVHFKIEQVARANGGFFLQFNGTAGIWRKEAIYDAGGWEHDTLTEDLDLSYRAQLKGWRIKYLEHVVTPGEIPIEMIGYRSQQHRWMKGGAETARKIIPHLWKSNAPLAIKIQGTFHLLSGSIYFLLLLSAFSSVPLLLLWPYSPISAPILSIFVIGLIIVTFLFFVANRNSKPSAFQSHFLFKFIFLFPIFLILSMGLSLHNSIAVLEGWLGKKSPFVRTPKWNSAITSSPIMLRNLKRSPTDLKSWIEVALSLYFALAAFFGIYHQNYIFLIYHIMFALGFGYVFWRTMRPQFNVDANT
jgi:cellulose synthase/poly-beta-1,6-N-acetylglucosamine synthase-like glycosyltransferase